MGSGFKPGPIVTEATGFTEEASPGEAKRGISSCWGEDWSSTREQPAASKSARRCRTCSGVPIRPEWRPRLETL